MAPLAPIVRTYGLNIVSYADDTQLILSLSNEPNTARRNFREGMEAVAKWMKNSCLQLNTNKTEVLIMGPNPDAWSDTWWPPALGNPPTPTDHARNLGIILDSELKMDRQINSVSSSCFHTLRLLRKTFKWIPLEHRKTVTHALVTSRLDYGNALYAGINKNLTRKLQNIQNAAARLVLNLPKHCHISQHLRTLHWLPVEARITFKMLTHAHKALHGTGPAYLNSRLKFHAPQRTLRSAQLSYAVVPRTRKTRSGGRSFSFLAAKAWNALPLHLRQTTSLPIFARNLKTWLFDRPPP